MLCNLIYPKLHHFCVLQEELASSDFTVCSQTAPGVKYMVRRLHTAPKCPEQALHVACELKECRHLCRNMYSCTCYDFLTAVTTVCKHVHAVHARFFSSVVEEQDSSPPVTVAKDDSSQQCKMSWSRLSHLLIQGDSLSCQVPSFSMIEERDSSQALSSSSSFRTSAFVAR